MAQVSRESKLGYGFLFAGVGLPYLIDKLTGSPFAATIVSCSCLTIGLALLVAGHLHRDNEPRERGAMATVVWFTLMGAMIGGVSGLLSGAVWTIIKQRQLATTRAAQPPTDTAATVATVATVTVAPGAPPQKETHTAPPTAEEIAEAIARKQASRQSTSASPQRTERYGNLKERTLSLAREIETDLYTHGWFNPPRDHVGALPGVIVPMPPVTDLDKSQRWLYARTSWFETRQLQRVKEIRDEFVARNWRDKELDDFLRSNAQFREMANRGGSAHWILPQQIERVAERLRVLAETID